MFKLNGKRGCSIKRVDITLMVILSFWEMFKKKIIYNTFYCSEPSI